MPIVLELWFDISTMRSSSSKSQVCFLLLRCLRAGSTDISTWRPPLEPEPCFRCFFELLLRGSPEFFRIPFVLAFLPRPSASSARIGTSILANKIGFSHSYSIRWFLIEGWAVEPKITFFFLENRENGNKCIEKVTMDSAVFLACYFMV